MGKYANKARYHEKQIRYYHATAGENGYKQAMYHWDELGRLRLSGDKTDAIVISEIIKSLDEIMTEMKDRAVE